MSDLRISFLLYGIIIIGGFVSSLYLVNIAIPIGASAIIGLFAGYFYEKYTKERRYGEPYFFRWVRLDVWGAMRGIFFSLIAYLLASFI